MKTIQDAKEWLETSLQNDEAKIEARIILESVLNINSSEIITKADELISSNEIQKIKDITKIRNEEKIPLAYILEEARFLDLNLFVNKDVLVPRPETELLVEKVLEEIKVRKIRQATILDIGTGSGCIAIALKKALPSATVYASDISKASLQVASINADKYNLDINFILGDYLDPFLGHLKSPIALPIIKGPPPYFDIVVSNPPYISEEDYQSLEAELFHEPKHALVGFPYEYLKQQLSGLIKENGFFVFEYGASQSNKLKEIFPDIEITKDLSGLDRIGLVNSYGKVSL